MIMAENEKLDDTQEIEVTGEVPPVVEPIVERINTPKWRMARDCGC